MDLLQRIQQQLRGGEAIVVVAIVFVVGLMVIPLHPLVLDLFLAASIGAALLVLLTALHTERPLEFSSFPAMLLVLTLYRLALNVSSTRLILGSGDAGNIIESFGDFVIAGNYAVGAVIFLVLVGINFVVISKGAGRVAEVAARFTLDALPGRQMSIDGDLSAGLIDEAEAKRRREEVSQEADFFGAMDGASKFVRGDAILGLLITGINIIGGLFVGMVQRGMSLDQALQQYTMLTVGDGLVSQIPALIISTAAGIMVTSTGSGQRVGSAIAGQLARQGRPMWIAAGFMGAMAFVPGMPKLPFLALAGGTALAARGAARREEEEALLPAGREVGAGAQDQEAIPDRTPVQDLLQIDPVEVEIGYALIALVDEGQGGDLLERIKLLRKKAALDMGILIPPIRIKDDVTLEPSTYIVKVRGTEVVRGEVRPRLLMALDTGGVLEEITGEATFDPSFGMPAKWITESQRLDAEASGYVVVEPSTVVATHLMESLKRHASELLGRQDVQEMLDTLKESYPALVDEVVPGKVSLGTLHRVLQRLLKEQVPIRDMVTILETMADASDTAKDPETLTEHVRRALANVIGESFLGPDGQIRGITLGGQLEAGLMGLFSPRAGAQSASAMMDPDVLTKLLSELDTLTRAHAMDGRPVPIITPPGLRIGVRRLIEPVLPNVPVISLAELPPHVNLKSVATWEMKRNAA
jgi:flagellar biosynthesis protein FlhA